MVERTTEYNQDSEGTIGERQGEKEVGPNCTLQLTNGLDVPVENVSFSEEANTSEVQYNDSFSQSIAVTGVSYSGSFDIPGNANRERDIGWDEGTTNEDNTTLPRYIENMSIIDGEDRSYTFTNVLLNSHSKDIPSDDRTSQSFDFMAEKMVAE
jgi:hypothetical protein